MASIDISESCVEVPAQLKDIVCAPEAQPTKCVKKTKEGIRCSYDTAKKGMHCLIYCKFHAGLHEKEFDKQQALMRHRVQVTYGALRDEQIRHAEMDLEMFSGLAAKSENCDQRMQDLTYQMEQIKHFHGGSRLGLSSQRPGFLTRIQAVPTASRAFIHRAPVSSSSAAPPPLPPRRYPTDRPVVEELGDEDQDFFRPLEDDLS